ncbi:MAG: DUF58 domain-containing protein [Gemmatimonadales bacterium]
MILPTRRALLLLALLAPLALLGYLAPVALDVMLAADAVVLALVYVDALLAVDPAQLALRREAPATFSMGRAGAARYLWTNPTSRAARLTVRETWPSVLGGARAVRAVVVAARGAAEESLAVQPARRGRDAFGWLALRSRGPLELGQRQSRRELPWDATVFPALPGSRLRQAIAEAARRQPGQDPARRLGEGRMFESLREWVPGDDLRSIDWKATARRRKLIAREYEEERRQQVMLVLDAGRLMASEADGVPVMEFAVRTALDLAFAAAHHDDDVGIMVFADRVQHYVAPQRGRRSLREILRALAVAEPVLVESDYPGAFRYLAVRNRKRALTVFIGDLIDRGASEALVSAVGALRPRHLPLAVTLRNPELDLAATARAGDERSAWRRAAAEELLAARGGALAVMRRSGVIVLDTPPARAGQAAVGAYLELKRRGRL